MKLQSAQFVILGTDDVSFVVDFQGHKSTVSVIGGDGTRADVDNVDHRYKPCVTHCCDLIRLATQRPSTNSFEDRRRKESRPVLKLFE